MPMGIVSDDELLKEITHLNTPPIKSDRPITITDARIESIPSKGRGVGNLEVPNSLRKLIGETAINDGRSEALELAANFNISESSVSAYSKGATSTATYDKTPNESHLTSVKERISKRARIKMMKAMEHITEEKMEVTKALDLSAIAKNMSAIVKNMEEKVDPLADIKNGPTFVIYAPQLINESKFDVIDLKE